MASFKLGFLVAKEKKLHNILEKFVRPCIIEIVKTLFDAPVIEKIKQIPMANNVVKNRVGLISETIL